MLAKWTSITLGLLLVLYCLGALVSFTWFSDDPEVEQFLCRFYLCDNEQLLDWAYEHLWEGDPRSLEWAVSAYQESLRRDPASPFRWCDLGEALERRGDLTRAKYCFERGVELGPNSPPVPLLTFAK